MHRTFLFFGVALIALMAGALFYAARLPVQNAQSGPAPESSAAPAASATAVYPSFSLPDLDGNERTLDEWAGRPRLVNFWATWCAPCRKEIPLLKAFQDEQGYDGVQVVGIAVDDPGAVAAFAADMKFNYPVVVGDEDAMAVAESSGIEFVGLPLTMIVAADGALLGFHYGEVVDADLEHIVRVLGLFGRGEIDAEQARKALHFL